MLNFPYEKNILQLDSGASDNGYNHLGLSILYDEDSHFVGPGLAISQCVVRYGHDSIHFRESSILIGLFSDGSAVLCSEIAVGKFGHAPEFEFETSPDEEYRMSE